MNRTPNCSNLLVALCVCCLGFGVIPARGGLPAYDAVQVILPGSQVANQLSQLNQDGALAFSQYDEARHLWATGIWVPRPLYGLSAGYHELYTSPGEPFQGTVYPFIDNAGAVNYYAIEGGSTITLGGANWSATYQFDNLPIPGWSDANVIYRNFNAFPRSQSTSDAAPYAAGLGEVTHRDGNNFQPHFSFHFPVLVNGGIQQVGQPEGDYGSIAVINRSGHAIWHIEDINPAYPGRVGGVNRRTVAVTPTGTHLIEDGYFMNGRGDITYGSEAKILLAEPLGPLGPGVHPQTAIPGMPANHRVAAMNSSGVFVTWQAVAGTENFVHILSGGKAVLFRNLLPPSVPVASDGMHRSDVNAINEAGMLLYEGVAFESGQYVYTGKFLLIPTLDCDVTLSGTQPYRLDEEFDLDVTVRNVAGASVTNVRVEGDQPGSLGISVSSGPNFDILSGPTPPGPVTILAGGTQVFRYHCRAKRSGQGNVTAKVKGTSATGTNLRTQSFAPIDIEQRGDLLIKLLEEPAASFAIDNVYQRVAATDAQARKVEIVSESDARIFEIKVQNDEPGAFAMRLFSVDAGSSAIPLKYFFGTTEITNQIKTSGWPTPELAAGGSIIVRVEFGPPEGATAGDSRSANISLHPIDGNNALDRVRIEVGNAPPIEVTLRRPMADGLTTESISAGNNSIDAPLEFKTDRAALETLPRVDRGLVADGVTPLLLEMIVPPEKFEGLEDDIHYNVSIEILSGGAIDGTPIDARLGVLKDGEWSTERELTFTTTENKHFARISPVGSDELQFSGGANELKVRLRFTEAESGAPAGDKTLYLRKPPIALVHGYNTNGNWGDGFAAILGVSRPRFTAQGGEDFIRTIRYGQDPPESGVTAKENTVMPFSNLAPILGTEFETMKSDLLHGWALTRFDVVAHSQGGLLTRMLCSKNANGFAGQPFRNADNFYRGRFHRVVTIGSPHNGTRLVRFMLDLQERLQQGNINGQLLPLAVSEIMIRTGISQEKFDPFGVQIARINQNDPNGPWYPDPAARFHLIQTTVHDGSAPNPNSYSYSEWALGLNFVGDLVIPRGSDGVVDFDSMAATSPEAGQGDPTNIFRMPASQQICHAFIPRVPETTGSEVIFADMFGGDFGQTESTTAAHHAIDALDQSSEISPAFSVFGPFRLPAPLPQSVADSIRAAANKITSRLNTIIRLVSGSASKTNRARTSSTHYEFQFRLDEGETFAGPVRWSAERYGGDGATGGIALQIVGDGVVSVNIDDSIPGDVVLFGTAITSDGNIIIGAPILVASIEPDPNTYYLSFIEVPPATGRYPVGAVIQPQLWANYERVDGNVGPLRLRRWIDPSEFFVYHSDDQAVVDITDPLSWKMLSVGSTLILSEWRGQYVPSSFTVYDGELGTDTDGDGLPDDFEQQYFGQPTAGDPAIDSDGDGATNREEYRAGTSPIDPKSVFRITEIRRQGEDIVITFPAVAYKRYALQRGCCPGGFDPIPIVTVTFSDSDVVREVTDVGGANYTANVYRVVVLP